MSYRLFSDPQYPFCVITDQKGAKKLQNYFDAIVVCETPHYSYLDKMSVYELSPYEETIFIDADSNIVNDISFLFDDFCANGATVSCLGHFKDITETVKPAHFGQAAIQKFGFAKFVVFNGGVYYYKKSQSAAALMKFIFDDLLPNYDLYELSLFNGKKADEPLMNVAMLYFGQKPLDTSKDIMKCISDLSSLKWDMKNRTCSAKVYQKWDVSPLIIHYGTTFNCSTAKYYYYNAKVRYRYRKIIPLFSWLVIAKEMVLWFINAITQKGFYRKDKLDWFKGHFTKEYFRDLWGRFRKK